MNASDSQTSSPYSAFLTLDLRERPSFDAASWTRWDEGGRPACEWLRWRRSRGDRPPSSAALGVMMSIQKRNESEEEDKRAPESEKVHGREMMVRAGQARRLEA